MGHAEKWRARVGGFSGVLFFLSVLDCCMFPNVLRTVSFPLIGDVQVNSNWYPWILLVCCNVWNPDCSFTGHLSGLLAGLVVASGGLDKIFASKEVLKRLERMPLFRFFVQDRYYVESPRVRTLDRNALRRLNSNAEVAVSVVDSLVSATMEAARSLELPSVQVAKLLLYLVLGMRILGFEFGVPVGTTSFYVVKKLREQNLVSEEDASENEPATQAPAPEWYPVLLVLPFLLPTGYGLLAAVIMVVLAIAWVLTKVPKILYLFLVAQLLGVGGGMLACVWMYFFPCERSTALAIDFDRLLDKFATVVFSPAEPAAFGETEVLEDDEADGLVWEVSENETNHPASDEEPMSSPCEQGIGEEKSQNLVGKIVRSEEGSLSSSELGINDDASEDLAGETECDMEELALPSDFQEAINALLASSENKRAVTKTLKTVITVGTNVFVKKAEKYRKIRVAALLDKCRTEAVDILLSVGFQRKFDLDDNEFLVFPVECQTPSWSEFGLTYAKAKLEAVENAINGSVQGQAAAAALRRQQASDRQRKQRKQKMAQGGYSAGLGGGDHRTIFYPGGT